MPKKQNRKGPTRYAKYNIKQRQSSMIQEKLAHPSARLLSQCFPVENL